MDYDLKQFNLSVGAHSIKVKALGVGYRDSGFSNVVQYMVEPTPTDLAKGDIIHFDALGDGTQKRFRVIKVDGDTTTLMSLDAFIASIYNQSSVTDTFDNGNSYLKYADSSLDSITNTTYYNTLKAEVKAAIVPTNRIQSCYYRPDSSASPDFQILASNGSTYYYERRTQKTIGNRNCFVLDLDDIKEYFGNSTSDVINYKDLLNMFFEQTTTLNKYIWTASACLVLTNNAFAVAGHIGFINNFTYNNECIIRPAFRINLSTVEYTKE